jgi:diguanylate cyclase (GGDEF)-like protein
VRVVRFGDLPREFLATLLGGVVCVPAFLFTASHGVDHGTLWPHLSELIELCAAAAAIVALSAATRRARGRDRQAWLALTATLVFWFLGTAVYTVRGFLFNRFEGQHLSAEVFYLCALPLAFVGFALFPADHGPLSGRLRQTLDALTVASSALFVSWDTALHTIVRHRASGVTGWLTLLYPITDLALCTFAVLIAARAPVNRRISISLLAAGMFSFALADSGGVTLEALHRYHVGGVTDIGWVLGLTLGSLSALTYGYQRREPTGEIVHSAEWRAALLPYALVVPAAAVALRDLLSGRLPDVGSIAIGAVVLLLVSCRQLLTVRENLQLVAKLTGSQSELRQQALHDVLTGLANRRLFRERLEESLRTMSPEEIAVVFVDLDDFKLINDTMGHATGDDLLRQVANRLQTCVRGTDVAARLGGDEFAVLLTGGGLVAAQAVAARLNRAMRQPILFGAQPVFIQASIGIAAGLDGGLNGGTGSDSSQQLLEQADMAMYAAKDAGKARVEVFEPAMRERLLDRAAVRDDLARALGRDQLSLNYQPIVDLATGAIVGAEALLRWRHPQRGFIPPLMFIPLAEETGLIAPIGRWVLATACAAAADWQDGSPAGGFQINVNVSAGQLLDTDIVEEVAAVLSSTGLRAGLLTIEITESVLMADNATVAAQLSALRGLGIRLAIDDFGTGYSGLSYLDRLPVDILKVDKAFVDRVEEPSSRPPLAGAIVGLGEMLGLDVVAEGIETAGQRHAMVDLGCRHGQGYLFSRPVDLDTFRAMIDTPHPALGEPLGAMSVGAPVGLVRRAADLPEQASAPLSG